MPFNLLKVYNEPLDFGALDEYQRGNSLKGVFNRDFVNVGDIIFNNKRITPCPQDGEIPMNTLFRHLTTSMVDKITRKREFEIDRSRRLHWVKFHLNLQKNADMLVFSVSEPEGNRTYIYDQDEKYVVVLEPKGPAHYYLLTAYNLTGKDAKRNKILKKFSRRLPDLI